MERKADCHRLIFMASHSTPGGVQEVWDELAREVCTAGEEAERVALYPGARQGSGNETVGSGWIHLSDRKPSSPMQLLKLCVAIARHLRRQQAPLVFVAMPVASVLVSIIASVCAPRTKVVICHHSPVDLAGTRLNLADTVAGMLPTTRRIVFVSRAMLAECHGKPRSYLAKCEVIANAVPRRFEPLIAALAQKTRERSSISKVIIAVGRLAPEKNLDTLFRALVDLPEVELRLVGDGPELKRLSALAQSLRIDQRVRFLGRLSRQQTLEQLSEASIFVQPSLFEGHSLALIEAASIGLPLLTSTAPGQVAALTLGDGTLAGIAVRPEDHNSFAQAVRSILQSRDTWNHWSARSTLLGQSVSSGWMVERYRAIVQRMFPTRSEAPVSGFRT